MKAFFFVEANIYLANNLSLEHHMFKIPWVQKGTVHSAAWLCVQRRLSGGVQSWL